MDKSSEKKKIKSKCSPQLHCFPEINSKDVNNNSIDNFKQNDISLKNDGDSKPWPNQNAENSDSEYERMIAKAHEEGYLDGYKNGQEEERKKIEKLALTISKSIENLELFKSSVIEHAKKSILKLALSISRKIILKEPTVSKGVILDVVKNALQMVVDPANLIIKINSHDFNYLNDNRGGIDTMFGHSTTLKIEPDDTVLQGGCIVETDFGDVDARIDLQFKIIEKALEEEFNLRSYKKKE